MSEAVLSTLLWRASWCWADLPGILFINLFQGVLPGQPILLIALLISMVTGMVVSLVHAYASVNMKANQSISGTAINMFAPAFAIFVARVIRNVQQIPFENQFRIEKIPVLGDIPVIGGMFFPECLYYYLSGNSDSGGFLCSSV